MRPDLASPPLFPRALFVGADPGLRAALQPAMERLGISEVETATSAAEAVRRAGLEDIDLIVMGPHSADPDERVGAVRTLVRNARCSLLVLREDAPMSTSEAYVSFDLSEQADHALLVAARIFDQVHARHTVDEDASNAGGARTEDDFLQELHDALREHMQAQIWSALPEGVRPLMEVACAEDPVDDLISATGALPLVIGSLARSRLATALLGSHAESVVVAAQGPVLVVRRKGASVGLLEGLVHR